MGPEGGHLACGDEGVGRMSEPVDIVKTACGLLCPRNDFQGLKVMVPAGGTREYLDPVRFLTNETSTQVFTPQLVQVSENRCLLLWCAGSAMYYVFLSADGTAEVFRDGVQLGAWTFNGRLPSRPRAADLVIGAGDDATAGFTGVLDELRMTAGFLSAERFMYAYTPGLACVIR